MCCPLLHLQCCTPSCSLCYSVDQGVATSAVTVTVTTTVVVTVTVTVGVTVTVAVTVTVVVSVSIIVTGTFYVAVTVTVALTVTVTNIAHGCSAGLLPCLHCIDHTSDPLGLPCKTPPPEETP